MFFFCNDSIIFLRLLSLSLSLSLSSLEWMNAVFGLKKKNIKRIFSSLIKRKLFSKLRAVVEEWRGRGGKTERAKGRDGGGIKYTQPSTFFFFLVSLLLLFQKFTLINESNRRIILSPLERVGLRIDPIELEKIFFF